MGRFLSTSRAVVADPIVSRPSIALSPSLQQGSKPSAAPVVPPPAAVAYNPLRSLALYFSLAYIFLRFSLLHEMIAIRFGVNTYLLYLVGVPALVLMFACGAFTRGLNAKVGKYWTFVAFWMIVCIPFSFWPGNSVKVVTTWLRSEFCMYFMVAGTILLAREVETVLKVVSAAFIANLFFFTFLVKVAAGRFFLDLDGGSVSNANDLAAHLLLGASLTLFNVIRPKTAFIWRVLNFGAVVYSLYFVFGSASRGALVAILAGFIYYFIAGGPKRFALLLAAPSMLMTGMLMSPESSRQRLLTLFGSGQEEEISAEAEASGEARRRLLDASIKATIKNPIFGVGPGEFMDYHGFDGNKRGLRGHWQVAHNSYTTISSELGFPGIIAFLGAMALSVTSLWRIRRRIRFQPQLRNISAMALSVEMAFVIFGISAFFLSLGYRYYFPFLCGVAVAIQICFAREAVPQLENAPARR